MKRYSKLVKTVSATLLLAVGAFLGIAMTETEVRNAVSKWQTGDRVVQNPWTAVIDYVGDNAVPVVNTFYDLYALTGRADGAFVQTRGNLTVGGQGAGLYRYDGSSSATTNTYTVSASVQGGRWIAIKPPMFVVTQAWNLTSLTTNTSASVLVTNFGSLPAPAVGDFVLASHPGLTNSGNLISAVVANGGIYAIAYNGGTSNLTLVSNTVRVAYWKN